jgi:hypothetical protein
MRENIRFLKTSNFYWTQQNNDISPTLSTCWVEGIFGLGWPHRACYFREGSIDYRGWDPALCHEPCVNVNNLGCDLLSASGPWFLATVFPNSTLSPHEYLPVFSGDFVGVLTTKVTESCSFKSWFMLGLTMRTAMLGLDPLPLADGLPLSPWIDAKDSWTDSDLTTTCLSWLPSNSIP